MVENFKILSSDLVKTKQNPESEFVSEPLRSLFVAVIKQTFKNIHGNLKPGCSNPSKKKSIWINMISEPVFASLNRLL